MNTITKFKLEVFVMKIFSRDKILSDIEIAQSCEMEPITAIAEEAGVDEEYLELYGKYKAKVDYRLLREPYRQRRRTPPCGCYNTRS